MGRCKTHLPQASKPSQKVLKHALVFAKFNHPLFKPLLGRSLLSAVATVVAQDTRAIETAYPRQPAKIRLPNEEIMFHAEKLYREW